MLGYAEADFSQRYIKAADNDIDNIDVNGDGMWLIVLSIQFFTDNGWQDLLAQFTQYK